MAEATGALPSQSDSREEPKHEAMLQSLSERLDISREGAEKLYSGGFKTPEAAANATPEKLKQLGLADEEVTKVRAYPHPPPAAPDALFEKWLETKARTSRKGSHRHRSRSDSNESENLLKRWVEGDDTALDSWLKSEKANEPPRAPAAPAPEVAPAAPMTPSTTPSPEVPPTSPEVKVETPSVPAPGPVPPAPPSEAPAAPAPPLSGAPHPQEPNRRFSEWLDSVTTRLNSGQLEGKTFVQEGTPFSVEFQGLVRRNRELDEELAHVKKGSVAVIKFVKSKEARLREEAIASKAEEIQGLKAKLAELEASKGGAKPATEKVTTASLAPMVEALKSKERLLNAREDELKAKLEEVQGRIDDLEKKKTPLLLREESTAKLEAELRLREEELKAKVRKYEADQRALQDPEILEKLKHLDDLDGEISRRETEVRAREEFLTRKLEELQGKESEVVDAELEKSEKEVKEDRAQERARTGVMRLDDLLYGGIPLGSNVLLNGGKHTGKEVLAKFLAAEGLKKGVPVLWVLTDTDPTMLREEMSLITRTYDEYERRGLVRYIDLYSSNLGNTETAANVTLIPITKEGALKELGTAVDQIATEFLKISRYYRLVFQSLSTVIAYLDARATLAFLQPFTGRRLRERAVAYYILETGMHDEGDIELLEHVMTGSINLKTESLKTFLSVKGVVDEVQSRAWVSYNFTRSNFSMGSFSLDHIR